VYKKFHYLIVLLCSFPSTGIWFLFLIRVLICIGAEGLRAAFVDLVKFLKIRADRYKNKIFLYGKEIPDGISYKEFDVLTDRIAYALEMIGLARGDHIAVLHPNSAQTIISYYSIFKLGGVVIPINPIYTPREIKYILNNSQAKALILHESFLSAIEEIKAEIPLVKHFIVREDTASMETAVTGYLGSPLASIKSRNFQPDDPAVIFYTSGTTGSPKGVILTHRNFCFGGPNCAQNYGLRENDVTIAVLPLVHVFCVASPVFGSLSSGGSVVVLERFKVEQVFEAIERYRVTWFPGVPTMFTYLLNDLSENCRDLSSLRMGLSGGASLPVEVLKEWEERFHADIIEVYGLTESTGLVTANPVYGTRKPGSIGITVSGIEARVVDKDAGELPRREIGELIYKGPNATRGYFNLPEETSEKIKSGWVHTGDHAWRDEEGYFYIVGREKELIICGGYNIYPREIEEVLHGHPDVNEAAVIGATDPVKGEIPRAFVSLKKGCEVTAEELLSFCKKNLAAYKIPRIVFMPELPKNITGKIMKKELPRE
jgi:long-chain acyl-CoA synthetase